tara:strand:+ start:601 stop:783 length:183 start_codon:yes stop_codon:yes gene_type:complete
MYLGNPPELKEHLLMPSISECLKKKRIATRSNGSDRLFYQCTKVKAVVEDGKIISISKSD